MISANLSTGNLNDGLHGDQNRGHRENSHRKIIHVDADCFFAAIEIRDDPSLRDRPVAVGGSASRRGVISTCNYQARTYGVRSAMASAYALRLCPELLLVPHSMDKYREASEAMREIFLRYTDVIEPLSLDEAYLDVTHSDCCKGSATRMAQEIRAEIEKTIGITVSAGVAPNKFVAKVASDWHKPNGLTVVTPEQLDEFVRQLSLRLIPGVGKVTAERLQRYGLHTCDDVRRLSVFQLTQCMGSYGVRLHELSRGLDERPVKTWRRRKSLSVEHTFGHDLRDLQACQQSLPELFVKLQQRLARVGDDYRVVKAFVKLKFDDFQSTTIERAGTQAVLNDYQQLLSEGFVRSSRPVRLLGLGVRFVDLQTDDSSQMQQLPLFHLA